MSSKRVFVVTGSNKGLGKSIVKLLLQDKEEKIVYLTSRNSELGQQAVKDLETLGLKPSYHQLDISDKKSITELRDYLVKEHGGLDVLVNNAGIAYKGSSTAPFSEQAEVTNKVNFFNTLDVCDVLFPILKTNARVCHVSSTVSEMYFRRMPDELKIRFTKNNLTIAGLKELIQEFVTAAKEDRLEETGWPTWSYGISKLGVSFMTNIQQNIVQQTYPSKNILINCCCPGMVDTGMTAGIHKGAVTPDVGADTPTYLALLPVDVIQPSGCYVKLREVHPFPPIN